MRKLIGWMAGVALAGGAAGAIAQDSPAGEEGGRRGRHGRLHKGALLEKYDANQNGVLDAEEREAAHKDRTARHEQMKARMLERFDANKNGVLDPEEKEAAKAEFGRRRAEFLKRFDANGDGKLDETERRAARKQFRGHGHRDHQGDQK